MFKFVVLCALVAAASAVSKFGGANYGSQHSQNSYGSQHSQNSYGSQHSGASSDDVHAEVKSFASDVRADGFQYAFDTTNNINAAASGDAYGNVHGDFGWVSPEGVHVALKYVADENGYQPSGDLLPTPPPVPVAILKALEYIRTHPPHQEPAHNNNNKNFGRHF